MTDEQNDLEFLRTYLKRLQKWYTDSFDLIPEDLRHRSEADKAKYEAEAERVARLADSNGFEGSLFRDYLFETPYDNPLSAQAIRRVRKQIETLAKLIAKLETSGEDKNTPSGIPTALEIDEAGQQVVCDGVRHDVTVEQVRILKCLLENPGAWVLGKKLKTHSDQRVDKLIKRLPEPVRAKIESHTVNGYRLKMAH